ncbi:MAG: hypothetical protein ABF488_09065 [Lentilactobacillus hilgardii]|jgi:hypothetical protein|nr:hypothetical protein HMPREF0496_1138 [Lentilactobacillus hilgardii ATCC 27305]
MKQELLWPKEGVILTRIKNVKKHVQKLMNQDHYKKHTELMAALLKYNLYVGRDLSWRKLAEDNDLKMDEARGYLSGRCTDLAMYDQLINYVKNEYSIIQSLDFHTNYPLSDLKKDNDDSSVKHSTFGISKIDNTSHPYYQYNLSSVGRPIRLSPDQFDTESSFSFKDNLHKSVKTIIISGTVN